MIPDARSETARSMISATATMEAARRNQIGQPAACRSANNLFPYRFSSCLRATVRQSARRRQVYAAQQSASDAMAGAKDVVDPAISTKICGQVCGLPLRGSAYRSHIWVRVGGDQKLSSLLPRENMRLCQRIVLRHACGGLSRQVLPLCG